MSKDKKQPKNFNLFKQRIAQWFERRQGKMSAIAFAQKLGVNRSTVYKYKNCHKTNDPIDYGIVELMAAYDEISFSDMLLLLDGRIDGVNTIDLWIELANPMELMDVAAKIIDATRQKQRILKEDLKELDSKLNCSNNLK